MTRTEARNQAFILIFEKSISDSDFDEIIECAADCRDFFLDDDGYIIKIFKGVYENLPFIDEKIKKNLTGWTINRISKVSLAILRLAIYEIDYCDDIPVSVSIDEAVELAKTYSTLEDSSFVNGVLGTVVREKENA